MCNQQPLRWADKKEEDSNIGKPIITPFNDILSSFDLAKAFITCNVCAGEQKKKKNRIGMGRTCVGLNYQNPNFVITESKAG